ncbi:hypothetical protein BDK92_7568 [Micromonospora pisi]|uniref:PH (Pleckstrin Homology) domain-containing protein n=1 Tax=Micromonospora pisi TaxID=589240 RepID=A0A495JW18_9ACTN|nr:hypothetical protein [Micromonospora pisi]RKR93061.1 hypothetical protein BDK92_7568 [Micromonospora pisi]
MEFSTSRTRLFYRVLVVFVPVWLFVSPLVSWLLVDDGPPGPWWGQLLQAVITGGLVAAFVAFVTPGMRPTWVRTSTQGLSLSVSGGDPINPAWSEIAHACVYRRYLRWKLEVTPAHSGQAITADVSLLAPGPTHLRRELARRPA